MRQGRNWTVALAALVASQPALAGVRWSVVGAGAFTGQAYSTDLSGFAVEDTTDGALGFPGFGALVEVPVGAGGQAGVELGALYLTYRESTNDLSPTPDATIRYHSMQFSGLFRFWANRYVSGALGLYFDSALGSVAGTAADGTEQTLTYGDLGRKQSDLGLMASVGLDLPIDQGISFLFDARYAFGLGDRSVDPSVLHDYRRDFQVLLGLRFGHLK